MMGWKRVNSLINMANVGIYVGFSGVIVGDVDMLFDMTLSPRGLDVS